MKKSHLSISGYIHLMIILLLLLEAGWLYSLYHAERRDFRYVTGKFIEDAIKEEIHTCPIQETNGLDDFSMKGRLIMTYTYKGKYFHIDTNSQLFLVFYEDGSISNLDVASNPSMKFVLMAFDAGTGLTPHRAPGNAIIFALEGKATIGYEGKDYVINAGENFRFEKNGLHSVTADEKFKMALLLVIE